MKTWLSNSDRIHSRSQSARFFTRHLINSFVSDNCHNVAGVLAFTTLLSIVPLMVVTIGVFSAFPAFERALNDIEKFIFTNFVPTAGEQVRLYLISFTRRASEATTVGITVLAATAVALLHTIESSLNAIWKSESRRHWVITVVIYWAVLTLGPILIGVSLVMSSQLSEWLPQLETMVGKNQTGTILSPLPLLATFLALCLLFTVIPARRLPFRYLAAGAAVGAILFELAKHGFGYYVHNLTSYEKVYGALAALPIFFMWTYISWVIVLLAAEISHTLYVYPRLYATRSLAVRDDLTVALDLIGHLWRAQQTGKTITMNKLLQQEPTLPNEQLKRVLHRLQTGEVAQKLQNGGIALVRDVHTLTLADLLRSHKYLLPDINPHAQNTHAGLAKYLQTAHTQLTQTLDVPLTQLLSLTPTTAPDKKTL